MGYRNRFCIGNSREESSFIVRNQKSENWEKKEKKRLNGIVR